MIQQPENYSTLTQDALKIIEERYPYLYGSTDIAQFLEVSSPHLIRNFKKELGETPTSYLIKFKLKQSKVLLLQENLYIDTVANLVGFSSGNYFAKVFKKHFQLSPSEYIRSMEGKTPEEIPVELTQFPELLL